jgi:hypothetical protein
MQHKTMEEQIRENEAKRLANKMAKRLAYFAATTLEQRHASMLDRLAIMKDGVATLEEELMGLAKELMDGRPPVKVTGPILPVDPMEFLTTREERGRKEL